MRIINEAKIIDQEYENHKVRWTKPGALESENVGLKPKSILTLVQKVNAYPHSALFPSQNCHAVAKIKEDDSS
jgi:hypothetical protein